MNLSIPEPYCIIGIQEGEGAPVDSLLAIIGPEGTDVDTVLNAKPSGGSDKKEGTVAEKTVDPPVVAASKPTENTSSTSGAVF